MKTLCRINCLYFNLEHSHSQLVSEADPRKIEREGLVNGVGLKLITEPSVRSQWSFLLNQAVTFYVFLFGVYSY